MTKEKHLNKEMKKENSRKLEKITKLFPQILLIIILGITTSCGKEKFNKELFTETVKKRDFSVIDLTEYKTIAVSDHYQISLEKFEDNSTCEEKYKKELKERNNRKIKEEKNYFYIKNKYVYTIIYKINNYLIEISAPSTYKDEINKILKEMDLEL